MRYEGILLDIDNTLYDYLPAHRMALSAALKKYARVFSLEENVLVEAYGDARQRIHLDLSGTASSHNRLLYFQRMFEALGVDSLRYSLDCYNLYWEAFLSGIELREGSREFLERVRDRKICIVTDLTSHIQHRKVRKLGLHEYADWMVTSEEAGRDKPHPSVFLLALGKMGLPPEAACMIGDDLEKDVHGALNLGIKPFWFDPSRDGRVVDERVTVVASFAELCRYFA